VVIANIAIESGRNITLHQKELTRQVGSCCMWYKKIILLLTLMTFVGCQSQNSLKTVDYVDIQRFMGDWYVIANIPTFL
jgi:hypothetical protein